MEPEGSLPHSQVPASCPCPQTDESSPYPHIHFLKVHLNIILSSTPGSPKWSLSLNFPQQNPVYVSSLPHTCYMPHSYSSRLYHPNNIGEEYRSLNSSLCCFLHFLVTSCLLDPNILLNTIFSYTQQTEKNEK